MRHASLDSQVLDRVCSGARLGPVIAGLGCCVFPQTCRSPMTSKLEAYMNSDFDRGGCALLIENPHERWLLMCQAGAPCTPNGYSREVAWPMPGTCCGFRLRARPRFLRGQRDNDVGERKGRDVLPEGRPDVGGEELADLVRGHKPPRAASGLGLRRRFRRSAPNSRGRRPLSLSESPRSTRLLFWQ